MTKKPYPFQLEGAQILASKRYWLLGDAPRLGKTVQSITAADSINAKNILVLCPSVARENWKREFQDWSIHDREISVLESKFSRCAPNGVIICSYDLALGAFKQVLSQFNLVTIQPRFDLIILDEIHNLKNPDAKRTNAVFESGGIARNGKRVWGLSGTPAKNYPNELWIILKMFGITKLSYAEFSDKFCVSVRHTWGTRIIGVREEALHELDFLLSKIMTRRTQEQVAVQMPDVNYCHVVVEPSEVDFESFRSLIPYHSTKELFKAQLKKEEDSLETVFNMGSAVDDLEIDAKLQAFARISNSLSTLRRYTGLQKMEGVLAYQTQELFDNDYQKLVIFGVHRELLETVFRRHEKFGARLLYGGLTSAKKESAIKNFQQNPKCRVLVCNIDSGKEAIDLSVADHIDFIEQSWVPSDNAQASLRCSKLGKRNPVFVRFFGIANSFDDRLTCALMRKSRWMLTVFGEKKLKESLQDRNVVDTGKSVIR